MKSGRNDPCSCGSGKKYKRCCGPADAAAQAAEAQTAQAAQAADASRPLPGGLSNATFHETWGGWGWPRDVTRALFQAAAAFYRAAPWQVLVDDQPLAVQTAAEWTAVVLGNGGIEFGLALYAQPEDYVRQRVAPSPPSAFASLQDLVLSFTFESRHQLSPRAQKEILAAGWEVAGPAAYPALLAINAPNHVVTPAQAGDLAALLSIIPRFVRAHQVMISPESGELEPPTPVAWTDPETGLALSYGGTVHLPVVLGEVSKRLAEALVDELTEEDLLDSDSFDDDEIGGIGEILEPSLPAGPNADPEAAIRTVMAPEPPESEWAVIERFRRYEAGKGRSRREIEDDVAPVTELLEFLSSTQRIPLAACTEYDLLVFLYDWIPRHVTELGGVTAVGNLPAALERFCDYLEADEGLVFPWAAKHLANRLKLALRCQSFPGGRGQDQEVQRWRAELYDEINDLAMLPDVHLADGDEWGSITGAVEAGLHAELQRRWLLWRDEIIHTGVNTPGEVWDLLVPRQQAWQTQPHPAHGGLTPLEVIQQQREARAGA